MRYACNPIIRCDQIIYARIGSCSELDRVAEVISRTRNDEYRSAILITGSDSEGMNSFMCAAEPALFRVTRTRTRTRAE